MRGGGMTSDFKQVQNGYVGTGQGSGGGGYEARKRGMLEVTGNVRANCERDDLLGPTPLAGGVSAQTRFEMPHRPPLSVTGRCVCVFVCVCVRERV